MAHPCLLVLLPLRAYSLLATRLFVTHHSVCHCTYLPQQHQQEVQRVKDSRDREISQLRALLTEVREQSEAAQRSLREDMLADLEAQKQR